MRHAACARRRRAACARRRRDGAGRAKDYSAAWVQWLQRHTTQRDKNREEKRTATWILVSLSPSCALEKLKERLVVKLDCFLVTDTKIPARPSTALRVTAMKPRRNLFLGILWAFLIDWSLASDSRGPNKTVVVNGDTKDAKNATKVISLETLRKSGLQFSRENRETLQQYWKETLEDIKNLAIRFPDTPSETTRRKPLTQWKQFLDEYQEDQKEKKRMGRPRFEGFASWERQLQLWTDEVSDYLEKVRNETGEYPFSTYGAKPAARNATEALEKKSPWELFLGQIDDSEGEEIKVKEKKQRPVPAPAKPDEAVLPHTNIADKSKRILIVTTAALPWMTGTAVNPLLRAAYLTNGRAEKGGSITLMLPWVERMSDQERVYGKDKTFNTQEEQEAYIRAWLRDTAGMEEASEQLQISWYTAWQERAENSLYSMGDITALISVCSIFSACLLS